MPRRFQELDSKEAREMALRAKEREREADRHDSWLLNYMFALDESREVASWRHIVDSPDFSFEKFSESVSPVDLPRHVSRLCGRANVGGESGSVECLYCYRSVNTTAIERQEVLAAAGEGVFEVEAENARLVISASGPGAIDLAIHGSGRYDVTLYDRQGALLHKATMGSTDEPHLSIPFDSIAGVVFVEIRE